MSGTRSPSPKAPATEVSLLLVAHGIEGRPGVAADHRDTIAAEGLFAEVRVGCIKGVPTLDDALDAAPEPVHVVPLLLADGFIMDLVRQRLDGRTDVTLHPPLGLHDDLVALLADKAARACRDAGWRTADTMLLLIGHGTPKHPESGATTEAAARAIAARGRFADVITAYLDQGSFLADVARHLTTPTVAVGLFMDEGPHGRDDVMEALAAATAPVVYAGPVGTDPAIVPLVLQLARRAVARTAA